MQQLQAWLQDCNTVKSALHTGLTTARAGRLGTARKPTPRQVAAGAPKPLMGVALPPSPATIPVTRVGARGEEHVQSRFRVLYVLRYCVAATCQPCSIITCGGHARIHKQRRCHLHSRTTSLLCGRVDTCFSGVPRGYAQRFEVHERQVSKLVTSPGSAVHVGAANSRDVVPIYMCR